jgi:hypothetical protein
MGRPKRYANAAEKQRAYRARLAAETIRVTRRHWAALIAQRERLGEAVRAARAAGCGTAAQIGGGSADAILDLLTAWFEVHAAGGCKCVRPDPPAAIRAPRRRQQP